MSIKGKSIARNFDDEFSAYSWVREQALKVPTPDDAQSLHHHAERVFSMMDDGRLLSRDRTPFKPVSVMNYRQSYRTHIDEYLGSRRVGEIKQGDIQEWADLLRADGKQPKVVTNALAALSAIFRTLRDERTVLLNPAVGIRTERIARAKVTIVQPGSIERQIAVLPPRERAFYGIGVYAGLRRGEIFGLRWEDVRWSADEIKIERAFAVRTRTLGDPKSYAGKRVVPLLPELKSILMEYRMEYDRYEGFVFGSGPEQPMRTAKQIYLNAKNAWIAAGLPHYKLHAMRHTFASMLIEDGADIKQVSQWIGHKDAGFTINTYGHLHDDSIKQYLAERKAKMEAAGVEPASGKRD